MSDTQTIVKLKEIIRPYVKEQSALENLNETTDFINDLKINSANLVDIVLDIEEVFGIEIDNQSMEKMLSVKAALDIINDKLAGKP
jgi:acyl carrier protein